MAKKLKEIIAAEAGRVMAAEMREKAPFSGPKLVDPRSGGAPANEIGALNCRLRQRFHRIEPVILF